MSKFVNGVGAVAVAVAASSFSVAASAATLDFTTIGSGYQGTTALTLPEATVTGLAANLYIGAGGAANSICSIQSGTCAADLLIDFAWDVSDLSFDVVGHNRNDFVTVTALDAMGAFLASFDINANGSFGFGGLGGISRVFFDDMSAASGVAYANFSFSKSENSGLDGDDFDGGDFNGGDDIGAVVPLPAPLFLLLGAFGVTGLVFRRSAA